MHSSSPFEKIKSFFCGSKKEPSPRADSAFNKIVDYNHPLADGFTPQWASSSGQDCYGAFTEISVGDVIQRLRWIPPGQFMMGSPDDEKEGLDGEKPQHPVIIAEGYWLFDTAVTQELWLAVMGENPSSFTDDHQLPVELVSWEDCQQFLQRLNERIPDLNLALPSEAQWEYGCRALTDSPFNGGHQIDAEQANYHGNYPYTDGKKGEYRNKTLPVKSFNANDWGLWQMHGNVWEWTKDRWHVNYEGAPSDGSAWESGDSTGRVVRGGSWNDHAKKLRSAYRNCDSPGYHNHYLREPDVEKPEKKGGNAINIRIFNRLLDFAWAI